MGSVAPNVDWYCRRGSELLGPMSTARLEQMIAARSVRDHDHVRVGANGEWISVAEIHRLFEGEAPTVDAAEAARVAEYVNYSKWPEFKGQGRKGVCLISTIRQIYKPEECARLDKTKPNVALIGDSHAVHWRAALAQLANAKRWVGISVAGSGCRFSAEAPTQPDPSVRRTSPVT